MEKLKKGNNLGEGEIIIETLSYEQMKILREIDEDTGDFYIKCGRSQLKFEINTYKTKQIKDLFY